MADTSAPKPTPAEREALGVREVTVAYGGQTFSMPSSIDDASGDVLDAWDDQKYSVILRSLLGPSQWARFKATGPTVSDYVGLLDAWAKAAGLGSSGE